LHKQQRFKTAYPAGFKTPQESPERSFALSRGYDSVFKTLNLGGLKPDMPPILVLDQDDEELELEFELEYQRSLTIEQRFEILFQLMRFVNEQLERNGHRKAFEIVVRP